MNIASNLKKINSEIGSATLVAVSKTIPLEAIREAYEAGQRIFGENRAQELQRKAEALPKDIEWHMIGHLQSNKVKYIAPFVSLIHSVNNLRLLKEINKRAKQNDKIIKVLLQAFIAEEESKSGMEKEEIQQLLESKDYSSMENIRVVGMMGMATFTDDQVKIKKEFSYLKEIYDNIKTNYFKNRDEFNILSMGMSGDYKIALDCGSNMVRIGSSIFGDREYN